MSDSVPDAAAPPGLIQPLTAGILAAVVGFSSSFAIVLQGLRGVGATADQAASGLFVLCLLQGALAVWLGLRLRQPVSLAWSTPGAALLIGAGIPQGGFGVAVTAFLIAGALVVLAGLWRPLARAVAAIPLPLAGAMLAGVLLDLCLAPVRAVEQVPALALPVVAAWLAGWCLARRYAVLIAVVVALAVIALAADLPPGAAAPVLPVPVAVRPVPDLLPALGIALPLFVVTMASQNVPGLAVLRSNGYVPRTGLVFVSTGLASMGAAIFGGHGLNLAAITAALCAGPEAGEDRARRYISSVTCGAAYLVIALGAGVAAGVVAAAPPVLIEAVAGLALLGSLGGALVTALAAEEHRTAAVVTFVTTASGLSIFGIGAAFWGMLAGGLLMAAERVSAS
ncbi:benzoate/H(+) symporter BenE family transporter [Mangrovicoccus algicola]|uniref:Benzoate/H(+) symporter BenE family transporter n=1 Tax=Mangrovicoccus algicola TaxID=2771008 RepID=A0A8J6YXK1_9RHOB|nr:benzoate/H(+) symporter BenE family transporter [Mangrovicoccus algicola]MBE3638299.1 benzoate/H(+) symporter BenE family transporter [Mangrovicoccus algicola]